MGFITRIQQLFSTEKTHKQDNTISVRHGEEYNLPQLLCSNTLSPMEDTVKFSNKNKVINNHKKLDPEKVKKEHGIGFWDNLCYSVADIVRPQDIKSILNRKYGLNKNSKPEDYKNAARQYFQDKLGDVTGLSYEEIDKRYKKIEKEFYIQLTRLEGTDSVTNGIISAIIGELKANGRVKAAEDMIGLSANILERHTRARHLQMDSEYNLTHRDAFGKAPDNAIEYEHLVFANMDEKGIEDSLKEIKTCASNINIEECKRLQALKNNPNVKLTKEQEDLLLKYENYILSGYAGGYTGISANEYVGQAFAVSQLSNIYNTTSQYGISEDVFETAYAFLQEHPDIEHTINMTRSQSFEALMDNATEGNYSSYISMRTNSTAGELNHIDNNTNVNTKQNSNTPVNDNIILEVNKVDNRQTSTESLRIEQENNQEVLSNHAPKEQIKTYENRISHTNDNYRNSGYNTKPVNIKEQQIAQVNTSNKSELTKQNKPKTLEDAASKGFTEYDEFIADNNIGYVEACITTLNCKNTNSYVRKIAEKRLTKQNATTQKYIYGKLTGTVQEQAAAKMDSVVLEQISTFNSFDAKSFAERKLEKDREKDNNYNNDGDITAA